MSFIKYPLPESVLQATEQRIQWVLDNFSRVCVSFSGGKDSTVMLHLTAQAARLQGKKSVCCLLTGKRSSPAPSPTAKNCVRCMRMLSKPLLGRPAAHHPKRADAV